jgi:hypothetical protein
LYARLNNGKNEATYVERHLTATSYEAAAAAAAMNYDTLSTKERWGMRRNIVGTQVRFFGLGQFKVGQR